MRHKYCSGAGTLLTAPDPYRRTTLSRPQIERLSVGPVVARGTGAIPVPNNPPAYGEQGYTGAQQPSLIWGACYTRARSLLVAPDLRWRSTTLPHMGSMFSAPPAVARGNRSRSWLAAPDLRQCPTNLPHMERMLAACPVVWCLLSVHTFREAGSLWTEIGTRSPWSETNIGLSPR